jgi:hypothetical protein
MVPAGEVGLDCTPISLQTFDHRLSLVRAAVLHFKCRCRDHFKIRHLAKGQRTVDVRVLVFEASILDQSGLHEGLFCFC